VVEKKKNRLKIADCSGRRLAAQAMARQEMQNLK
jgi:hypothetical protein